MYCFDLDPSGRGFAVIPIKLRAGLSGEPNLSGFLMTLKALAELDYARGTLTPWIMGGITLVGTIGGQGVPLTY